jgi:ubiquinol-cytochrome c reductase cytochrome b subunit
MMLGLVMAAGATGYSLPWDARAFFSTRVAEGLLAGLPFAGRNARLWLLGGNEISTLTLSRFFALHVLVTPFLILVVLGLRLAFQQHQHLSSSIISRSAIVASAVFFALAIWALKHTAPLGPPVSDVTTDYLPRPGAQFLWLYESLKHLPGGLGSFVGVMLPGLGLLILLLLPWLNLSYLRRLSNEPQRLLANIILAAAALWILSMTITSYLSDRRDPRVQQQLLKQEAEERIFRSAPFRPAALNVGPVASVRADGAPPAYTRLCANCHGEHGEGARQGTLRFPPLIGVSAKPRRTVDDIVGLLNDPSSYGLEPPMRSFATKLTDEEKREIAHWLMTLK